MKRLFATVTVMEPCWPYWFPQRLIVQLAFLTKSGNRVERSTTVLCPGYVRPALRMLWKQLRRFA